MILVPFRWAAEQSKSKQQQIAKTIIATHIQSKLGRHRDEKDSRPKMSRSSDSLVALVRITGAHWCLEISIRIRVNTLFCWDYLAVAIFLYVTPWSTGRRFFKKPTASGDGVQFTVNFGWDFKKKKNLAAKRGPCAASLTFHAFDGLFANGQITIGRLSQKGEHFLHQLSHPAIKHHSCHSPQSINREEDMSEKNVILLPLPLHNVPMSNVTCDSSDTCNGNNRVWLSRIIVSLQMVALTWHAR